MLRLVLPKGSLEKATLDLFEDADLHVRRSSDVEYKATIDDPRVVDVQILRPQEIPSYVEEGLYDLGICGLDWVEETNSDVVSLGQLQYSKATSRPFNIVLAVAQDAPWQKVEDLPDGVRVSTEYVGLTTRFLEKHGVNASVRLSYGATEAKIPDVADVVVDGTETGRALRAAKLRVLDTIVASYTVLIANRAAYDDPQKRHAMNQLHTLLQGVLEARAKVLVKLNVGRDDLDKVIALVPSMKSPTVNELFGGSGYAVETVVPKSEINILIPALKDAGATDIIELDVPDCRPAARRGAGGRPFGRSRLAAPSEAIDVVTGVVTSWDEPGGYGTITAEDGAEHFFHCTQLVDGSRTTEVGQRVSFDVEPGRLGRWEATNIEKHPSENGS